MAKTGGRIRTVVKEKSYQYEKESESSSDDSSYNEQSDDTQSVVSYSDSEEEEEEEEEEESSSVDVFSKASEEEQDERELLKEIVKNQKKLRHKEKKRLQVNVNDDAGANPLKQVRKRLDFDASDSDSSEEGERPANKIKKDTTVECVK